PKIPGVAVPTRQQKAYRGVYGPEFRTLGVIGNEPPKVGKPFPTLLPQVVAAGIETTGIRIPEIQPPLGPSAGWNLRSREIGAPDELFSMVGSFIPFARTRLEREKSNDPRRSIEERYKSRADYLQRVELSARNLVAGGYLLEQDVPKLVERGAA